VVACGRDYGISVPDMAGISLFANDKDTILRDVGFEVLTAIMKSPVF
jgi:hypothetical protein